MLQFLLQTVGVVVAGLLFTWWRARWARRTRQHYELDGEMSFRARMALEGERLRAGRVVVTGGRAVWTAQRGGRQVDLHGARLLSGAEARGRRVQPDDVALRLRLPAGGTAQVVLQAELADLLAELLPQLAEQPGDLSAGAPTAWRPGRAWWGWALIIIGLLFMATASVNALTGYSTTATVVSGDSDRNDGFCPAVWEDPSGRHQQGEIDCDDDPAGVQLREWVGGWPDGEPTRTSTYAFVALLFGLPPVAGGAWRLIHLRHQRRAWVAATTTPGVPVTVVPDLPPLREEDVTTGPGDSPQAVVSRLAPYAACQLPHSGWTDPQRPAGARSTAPASRFAARLWAPAVVVAVVLTVAWPWPQRWYVLHTHETTTVEGASTGTFPVDDAGPIPGELTVQFSGPDGALQRADVVTHVKPAAGTRMTVQYVTDAPQWARLTGQDDDLGGGTLIWALVTGLALLVAGFRIRRLVNRHRATRRARTARSRPGLGLLTADPEGGPLLLVTDPLVTPFRFTAVPLAQPLPAGAAAAIRPDTQLAMHGHLDDGQAVVVRVPGVDGVLLPAGPAASLDAEDVVVLLDLAHVLEDDEGPDELDRVDQER